MKRKVETFDDLGPWMEADEDKRRRDWEPFTFEQAFVMATQEMAKLRERSVGIERRLAEMHLPPLERRIGDRLMEVREADGWPVLVFEHGSIVVIADEDGGGVSFEEEK